MRARIYLIVFVAASLLAACGGDSGATTTAPSPDAGSTTTVGPPDAADPAATTTTDATTPTPPGPGDTTTTAPFGLDDLDLDADPAQLFEVIGADTFRQRFRTEVEASVATGSGTFVMEYAYVKEPPSMHLVMDIAGEGEEAGRIEIIQIGEEAWLFEGGIWQTVPPQALDLFSATAAVPLAAGVVEASGGSDADLIGSETVNGRDTRHYRIVLDDPPADPAGGTVDRIEADLWIDAEGEFLIRAHYVVSGTDADGAPVLYTVDLDVFDIGAEITITPPG